MQIKLKMDLRIPIQPQQPVRNQLKTILNLEKKGKSAMKGEDSQATPEPVIKAISNKGAQNSTLNSAEKT